MNYLLALLLGYLLGSIPAAFLILKAKGLDITKEGSGNVGAMNSFEVTNSKAVGFLVFIIDFLKGSAAVLLARFLLQDIFILPALALIFAVLSHNYNPWLKLNGGRGLATAAGGAFFLFPFMLVVWLIMWVIAYLIKKDIHFGNIWGTIFTLVIIFLSSNIAAKYTFPKGDAELALLCASAILIMIFIKHIEPLKEIINSKKIFSRGRGDEFNK